MVAASLSNELRREQIALAERVTAEMLVVYGSLNFKAIDMSSPGFIEAAVSVAERAHREGAVLGGDMYLSMRRDANVAGQFRVFQPEFDADQLRRDLTILGPVAAKRLMSQGQRIPQAAQTVFTLTSGRVARNALDGVRDAIIGSSVEDSQAIAYARQVASDACDFCLLMSENTYRSAYAALYADGSRGRRNPNAQAAGEKFHDHCRCTVVTLFNGQLPERARQRDEFRAAWNEATRQGVDPYEFIERTGKGAAYVAAYAR